MNQGLITKMREAAAENVALRDWLLYTMTTTAPPLPTGAATSAKQDAQMAQQTFGGNTTAQWLQDIDVLLGVTNTWLNGIDDLLGVTGGSKITQWLEFIEQWNNAINANLTTINTSTLPFNGLTIAEQIETLRTELANISTAPLQTVGNDTLGEIQTLLGEASGLNITEWLSLIRDTTLNLSSDGVQNRGMTLIYTGANRVTLSDGDDETSMANALTAKNAAIETILNTLKTTHSCEAIVTFDSGISTTFNVTIGYHWWVSITGVTL